LGDNDLTDGRPPAKLKGVYGKEEIKDLMAEEIIPPTM
jgi:hypothetical protein